MGWIQTVQRVEQLRRGLEPGAGYQGQAAGLGGDRMETEARELGHRRATRGSGGDPNVVQQLWKLSEYYCDSLVRRFGSISRLPRIDRSIDRFEKKLTFVRSCQMVSNNSQMVPNDSNMVLNDS